MTGGKKTQGDYRRCGEKGKSLPGFCHYKIAEVCTSTHFAVEWSKFIVCSWMTLTLNPIWPDKLIRIIAPPQV